MAFFIDTSRDMQVRTQTGEIVAVPVIVRTEVEEYVQTAFHEETKKQNYLSQVDGPDGYIDQKADHVYETVIVYNPVVGKRFVIKAADVGLEELVWWEEEISVIDPDESDVVEKRDSSNIEEPDSENIAGVSEYDEHGRRTNRKPSREEQKERLKEEVEEAVANTVEDHVESEEDSDIDASVRDIDASVKERDKDDETRQTDVIESDSTDDVDSTADESDADDAESDAADNKGNDSDDDSNGTQWSRKSGSGY